MPCSDYSNITDPLGNFSGQAPLDSAICPYTAGYGADLGLTLFVLLVFAPLGFGLTVKARHPGPLVIMSIFAAALITPSLPGIAAKILALVLFFAIAGISLIIYQKMQSGL